MADLEAYKGNPARTSEQVDALLRLLLEQHTGKDGQRSWGQLTQDFAALAVEPRSKQWLQKRSRKLAPAEQPQDQQSAPQPERQRQQPGSRSTAATAAQLQQLQPQTQTPQPQQPEQPQPQQPPHEQQQFTELLELRPVPKMGLGVFAKAHINAGVLLLLERPALAQTKHGQALEPLFEPLGRAAKETIMALRDDGEERSLETIFRKNAIPCSPEREHGPPARGLFLKASRFNHSCSPNAFYSWNEAVGALQVRAVRPVTAGSEVCTAYLDPSCAWEQRQSEFQRTFSRPCCCGTCCLVGAARAESDGNRARIQQLRDRLERGDVSDMQEGLACVKEILELYVREDLSWPIMTARMAADAFFIIIQSGPRTQKTLTEARSLALLASEHYGIMWGEAHVKAKLLRGFVEDPSPAKAQEVARKLSDLMG